jgi:hypothetical protein
METKKHGGIVGNSTVQIFFTFILLNTIKHTQYARLLQARIGGNGSPWGLVKKNSHSQIPPNTTDLKEAEK